MRRKNVSADLDQELFVPGRSQSCVKALGAPGQHAVDGIDVDGALSQTVQQELLVDDVLSCKKKITT